MDVPLIMEGGVGIIVEERFVWVVQTVWPQESIIGLKSSDFQKRMNKVKVNAFGHYKGDRQPRHSFNGSNEYDFQEDFNIMLHEPGWNRLSEEQIRRGIEILSQDDCPNRDWSCGPNSGARALRMLDYRIRHFHRFVSQCPTSWSLVQKVSPTPSQLAGYVESIATNHHACASWDENFDYFLAKVRFAMEHEMPLIVLIVRSFANMHYVNVIGYNDKERKAAILDTNKIIYWMTYDELAWWMTAEGHALKLLGTLDNYNAIRLLPPYLG